MDFNYELLEKTRKEVMDMVFFKESAEIDEDEYEVIHDYDQARENAFRRYYGYGESDGYLWNDILESKMAEVYKLIYQYDNYVDLFKTIRSVSIDEVEDVEYTDEAMAAYDQIYADISDCTISRFVCGKGNPFFESLFKAYKLVVQGFAETA